MRTSTSGGAGRDASARRRRQRAAAADRLAHGPVDVLSAAAQSPAVTRSRALRGRDEERLSQFPRLRRALSRREVHGDPLNPHLDAVSPLPVAAALAWSCAKLMPAFHLHPLAYQRGLVSGPAQKPAPVEHHADRALPLGSLMPQCLPGRVPAMKRCACPPQRPPRTARTGTGSCRWFPGRMEHADLVFAHDHDWVLILCRRGWGLQTFPFFWHSSQYHSPVGIASSSAPVVAAVRAPVAGTKSSRRRVARTRAGNILELRG